MNLKVFAVIFYDSNKRMEYISYEVAKSKEEVINWYNESQDEDWQTNVKIEETRLTALMPYGFDEISEIEKFIKEGERYLIGLNKQENKIYPNLGKFAVLLSFGEVMKTYTCSTPYAISITDFLRK